MLNKRIFINTKTLIMITAEEFLINQRIVKEVPHSLECELLKSWIRDFAKLHCIEQAKVISEKITMTNDYGPSGELFECIDKDSILNAYSLDNIK